ncbi:helix-turn-helix transcriptional regulator [Spirosoma sp. BT702]|uniref:Helix-turn-helix transcriptional regulator n=1 Tax=Spirosoma profusum TaxID=2771354 RepID=A0A926Y0N0_9BACT|nr:helix-turn-helix domain-containing protein [Spirosoma profusum]MBD2703711.1 helix-turn-helix transcriptional regulator [Spirosoma profusum]
MKINDQEVAFEIEGKRYHCAMDITMDYIGGKWKTVVLWYLRNDKKRFGELRQLIPQITERMLSIQLKQLEEDGLVRREVFATKPPLKVDYSLTDFGRTLLPVLEAVAKWGRELGHSKGELVEIKSGLNKG